VPTYQIQAAVAGAGPFALGESPVVGYSLVDGATPLASFAISPTTGITSYLWEIWSTAGGVSAVLSSTTAAAPTFPLQADTAGTYLLRCTINGASVAKIGVSVTTATRALRIPAAGEQLEFGADGWATAIQALYSAVQRAAVNFVFRGGGTWTCVAGASDYDVTWSDDIVIEDPEIGEAITISAATLAAVPEGDVLYVTPSTDPITTETLTMANASVTPSESVTIGCVRNGAILTVPFFLTPCYSVTHITGSASSAGGTVQGEIHIGVNAGLTHGLRVVAAGNTVLSTIELFADSARTDRVYLASGKDCYTSPYHVDRTPWMLQSFDNNLVDGILYYTITNNGANDSTYTIEVVGEGRV
jgi:hypothetical protein